MNAIRSEVTPKDLALLPMWAALGTAMIVHGWGKLKGEEALSQTGQFFETIGIRPGRFWAAATGAAELAAGTLALLGIGTRLAALAVLVTQAVAAIRVHAPKGFDFMKGGMEYNLALMAIALGLLAEGPGRVSAHERIERLVEGRGPRRFLRRVRPSRRLRLLHAIK